MAFKGKKVTAARKTQNLLRMYDKVTEREWRSRHKSELSISSKLFMLIALAIISVILGGLACVGWCYICQLLR